MTQNVSEYMLVLALCLVGNSKNIMLETMGTLFGWYVQVLRDTGCSTVVVRWFSSNENYREGRSLVCMQICGTVR